MLRAGVPEAKRVGAGDQRGQVGAAAATDPRQAGKPEVGVLHDGAGEAVEAGALYVDEELCRGAMRKTTAGGCRDHADRSPSRREDDGGKQWHEPTQEGAAREDGHEDTVHQGHCEFTENLWARSATRATLRPCGCS
jgi:hypothetical protein